MQWKLFLTLLASVISSALAAVPTILHWQTNLSAAMTADSVGRVFGNSVGGIVLAIVVIVTGFIAGSFVDSAVHRAHMFRALPCSRRDHIVFLIRIAIGAYTVWTCAFIIRPDLLSVHIATLALLSVVVYCSALAEEYYMNRPLPEKSKELEPDLIAQTEYAKHTVYMGDILARSGHPRVKVVGFEPVTDGNDNVVSRQYTVQTPASDRVGKGTN